MKQFVVTVLRQLAGAAAVLLVLYALGAAGRQVAAHDPRAGRLRVALFVNGTLGDKSFFDSAAAGIGMLERSGAARTKIIEGGTDPTRWEAALSDLADSGDYDLIVAGTFTMAPYVQKLAAAFPSARFVLFDAQVDYRRCACRNVYSVLFRQNEGAYLAGWLAARLIRAGLPGAEGSARVGAVGGMPIPSIDDFLIGFKAGAGAGWPALEVDSQYANGFSDPAIGKEIAKAQFGRGAALVFHAAGATGQGVTEAAVEAGRYAIGVDMDQYAFYRVGHPRRAAHIVTSVLKRVDRAIVRAVDLHRRQRLPYGQAESLGLAEDAVGLALHSAVLDRADRALLAELGATRRAIEQGRIHVPSAFAPTVSP